MQPSRRFQMLASRSSEIQFKSDKEKKKKKAQSHATAQCLLIEATPTFIFVLFVSEFWSLGRLWDGKGEDGVDAAYFLNANVLE